MRYFRKLTIKKQLAFVLGGGGARGALQVGALRALFEAGYKPDLLVGTSIGAVNAASIALWGLNITGIDRLEEAWQSAAEESLLDPRLFRLFLRHLLGRSNGNINARMAKFFTARGITPDITFGQLDTVRLALIGSDLNSGQPVIYGQEADQSIQDGLLASIALPPWFAPIEKEGHYIIDGGFVSNLPIEPALTMGATEIIALDIGAPVYMSGNRGELFIQYAQQLASAINQRYISLETALATARSVPVHHIQLQCEEAPQIWDFSNHEKLFKLGYTMTHQQLEQRRHNKR